MGAQVPGRGTSSAADEPRIILPPMDPPIPPLTFRRPLLFRMVLKLQRVGITHCLRTIRWVTTWLPSSRATTTGPSGAFVTIVRPRASGSLMVTLLWATAGAASPMAALIRAAVRDLFRLVIFAPFLAGDRAPAFHDAPAGCPVLGTIDETTVRRVFFFIGGPKKFII